MEKMERAVVRDEKQPVRCSGRVPRFRKKIFPRKKNVARSATINLHSFTLHLYGKAADKNGGK